MTLQAEKKINLRDITPKISIRRRRTRDWICVIDNEELLVRELIFLERGLSLRLSVSFGLLRDVEFELIAI